RAWVRGPSRQRLRPPGRSSGRIAVHGTGLTERTHAIRFRDPAHFSRPFKKRLARALIDGELAGVSNVAMRHPLAVLFVVLCLSLTVAVGPASARELIGIRWNAALSHEEFGALNTSTG